MFNSIKKMLTKVKDHFEEYNQELDLAIQISNIGDVNNSQAKAFINIVLLLQEKKLSGTFMIGDYKIIACNGVITEAFIIGDNDSYLIQK